MHVTSVSSITTMKPAGCHDIECPLSPQEVALIGMLAYLSYLCGELLGISGIVSLFCCGVVTSHYVSARPFCTPAGLSKTNNGAFRKPNAADLPGGAGYTTMRPPADP